MKTKIEKHLEVSIDNISAIHKNIRSPKNKIPDEGYKEHTQEVGG